MPAGLLAKGWVVCTGVNDISVAIVLPDHAQLKWNHKWCGTGGSVAADMIQCCCFASSYMVTLNFKGWGGDFCCCGL